MSVDTRLLFASPAADVWAQQFVDQFADDPASAVTFGVMVGWFANAMETAKNLQPKPDNAALIDRVRTYRDAWGPNPGIDHKGPRPPFPPPPGLRLQGLLDDVIEALGGTK